jgi:hypothetical protein
MCQRNDEGHGELWVPFKRFAVLTIKHLSEFTEITSHVNKKRSDFSFTRIAEVGEGDDCSVFEFFSFKKTTTETYLTK